MIKGCQKRIVFLKDTGSDYFEEAYFVIKPSVNPINTDIVSEATRIVNSSLKDTYKRRRFLSLPSLFLGLFSGIGLTLLLCLII